MDGDLGCHRYRNGLTFLYWFGVTVFVNNCAALENGLARSPPMGWMSWTRFKCEIDCQRHPFECINENLYTSHADRLVADGYADVGYNHIHIDDCWTELRRDANGRLVANSQRFPRGIQGLINYVHSRGLKFGIYADYGKFTCGGYPGSMSFENVDAFSFAEWQVDYLKLDGCWSTIYQMESGYPLFHYHLNASGRPIVYSCSWPAYVQNKPSINYAQIAQHCNLWRNYPDIDNTWGSMFYIIKEYIAAQDQLIPHHGPGHWHDPDMLVIGNPGISLGMARIQMTVWCIWSSPLIMSNDLRNIDPQSKAILLNRKAIAIDQDPMGRMGRMTSQMWYFVKPITPVVSKGQTSSYSFAVGIVNFSNRPASRSTTLASLGLTDSNGYDCEDIWENRHLGAYMNWNAFLDVVPALDAKFYKCTVRGLQNTEAPFSRRQIAVSRRVTRTWLPILWRINQ